MKLNQDPHIDGGCFFKADKLDSDQKLHPYLYYFIAAFITVRALNLMINWRQLRRYRDQVMDPYLQTEFK